MFKRIVSKVAVIGGGLALVVASWSAVQLLRPNDQIPNAKIFIESGTGINAISRKLDAENVITSKLIFETYLWVRQQEGAVRAGAYVFEPGLSIIEVTRRLTTGQGSKAEQALTVIEGWTKQDIANAFAQKTTASAEDFLRVVNTPEASAELQGRSFEFLVDLPKEAGLEGFLFPDTYGILKRTTPPEMIVKMLNNFNRKWSSSFKENMKGNQHSFFEIVTMASLLEAEVKTAEDRRNVADVFWKRLEIGMPLQSDATISYLVGKESSELTSEDLSIDSPYNTYRYSGLPAGPIGNPGQSAIEAAIDPLHNDDLYFLTTPKGKAIFSSALEEHNLNKARFLK